MVENPEIIYRDKNAKRIEEGNILRVFHFIGGRRKIHYMYKICAKKEGHLVAMDIFELYTQGREKAHTCRLEALPLCETEVISDYNVTELSNG